jgi:hypothetical protein
LVTCSRNTGQPAESSDSEAHLKLNLEKCRFFQKNVWYLDHIVSSEGVNTDTKKLKAVQEWPTPREKHKIRRLLGLCTYYMWFICSLAESVKLLTRLTEKKEAFLWSPEVEAAFQLLKEALCTTPVLGYSQPGEKFIVDRCE